MNCTSAASFKRTAWRQRVCFLIDLYLRLAPALTTK